MRTLSNAEYWDQPALVTSQQVVRPLLHWYEEALLDRCESLLDQGDGGALTRPYLYDIGCGPGREIPMLHARFPTAAFVACDIAPSMIRACKANLVRWRVAADVDLRTCSASELEVGPKRAQLVLLLNNVLTYVTPAEERQRTMVSLRSVLEPGGVIAGVVHHRWGRPLKSCYFALQTLRSWVGPFRQECGDRVGGHADVRMRFHYFTQREVRRLLTETGFCSIWVTSLRSFSSQREIRYPLWRGDNNLLFTAQVE